MNLQLPVSSGKRKSFLQKGQSCPLQQSLPHSVPIPSSSLSCSSCSSLPTGRCSRRQASLGGSPSSPLYNVYIAFKIAWKDQTAFWVWLAANVVYGLFRDHEDGVSGVITIAAGTLALVWWMRFCMKQARSYGRGTGAGIAAFFLPNIMTLYYGFASSCTYAGPQD